jgi:ATP-binding cassette subfamily B protein
MDPASGRRWTTCEQFVTEVYRHTQSVPAEAWREWAESESFQAPLRERLRTLGVRGAIDARPATLDAAARMVAALLRSGAIDRRDSPGMIRSLCATPEMIPKSYWTAVPDPAQPDNVLITGAVLLRARGVGQAAAELAPDLAAALQEPPARPGRDLLRMVLADGVVAPSALVSALGLGAACVALQALLFRGLFDLGRELVLSGQRLSAMAALIAFLTCIMALETGAALGIARAGRRLECRLRLAFLRKIPRLGDSYFRSRLASDMAERSHSAHRLRQAPELAGRLLRPLFEMAFTVAGIAWIYPHSTLWAALAAAVSLLIPLAAQPALAERDLRLRSHAGALTRFYLDSLLGLVAVRAHGAARSIRREQESLLHHWAVAGLAYQRAVTVADGVQCAIGLALAAGLVLSGIQHGGEPAGLLLLVYWALNLLALGQEFGAAAWQYPSQRNMMLRLVEPLTAPAEPQADRDSSVAPEARGRAVSIRMEKVMVHAGGHPILSDIDLDLTPGSHTAIVGPSGAGKSSLAGILLGWHKVASGRVLIDGEELDPAQLRTQTAWVDPQVQLWNRSVLDNLLYGSDPEAAVSLDETLRASGLHQVLRNLPDGLQTVLGEGGALVSGGEGQRVRAARAMTRRDARLVILDEPARGLDRARRRALLDRARELWRDATLLYITHDVADAGDFERVLVIEDGRIVEDGAPMQLAARLDSHYRALLDAEHAVRRGLWANRKWRRLHMDAGSLSEDAKEAVCAES